MTMDGLDDREIHIPATSKICDYCRHRVFLPHRSCAAFPGGIPMPIWRGRHNHQSAYPGDHGIRYSPLRPEDIETIESMAAGDRPVKGASIAELTERRRRVAS
ncbi:MAG TPA: hypothetical protein VH482_19930 [Thermomicrobiales bacterium]